MGYCPSQNTQNQCQGDAVVQGEGETGPPCSRQRTSSQDEFLLWPVSRLKIKKLKYFTN